MVGPLSVARIFAVIAGTLLSLSLLYAVIGIISGGSFLDTPGWHRFFIRLCVVAGLTYATAGVMQIRQILKKKK